MTPVTSVSAVPSSHSASEARPEISRAEAQPRDRADRTSQTRLEKKLEAAGVDDATVARIKENLQSLFNGNGEASATAAQGDFREKVESVFAQNGVDFNRVHGRVEYPTYGKIVTRGGDGQIQLSEPPAAGSLRHLLRAVEEVRAGHADDAPATKTESTLQSLLGVDITV